MDEQVKARLIGATVLVVIAVALVPELLSGPKRGTEATTDAKPGTRTVVIDLGGAVANATRTPQAEPAPAAAREPARLAPVEVPGESARRDAPADSKGGDPAPPDPVAASEPITPPPATPVKRVASSGEAKTPVPATSGRWAVQVGAFGSAESARKLVSDLKKDGLSAYVAPLQRDGKTLHRVRVGPAATRADADRLAARIKGRGLPATVVAPD